ncbi:HutD family protein [Lichenihabitans sp. PAMC28606]|nr:HutD family protein [Lichenihabitans sp. PAMC28606]
MDGFGSLALFAGDEPVVGRLIGGSIRDLNVMTRRGLCRHGVSRLDAGSKDVSVDCVDWIVLVSLDEACRVRVRDRALELGRLDSVMIDGHKEGAAFIETSGALICVVLTLEAASG